MRTRYLLPLMAAALLMLACSKSDNDASAEASAPSASVGAAPAPDPPAGATAEGGLRQPTTTLRDTEIPTEEDFENEAQERITAANLEAALDELESELVDQ